MPKWMRRAAQRGMTVGEQAAKRPLASHSWMRRLHQGLSDRRHAQRGMTLIEIMVVLVILGLVAGAIAVAVIPQLREAEIRQAKLDIKKLEGALDLYKIEERGYPDSLGSLAPKFVKEVKKDPWGNDYVYVRSGDGFEIMSYGPDKSQGGADDISSAAATAAGP